MKITDRITGEVEFDVVHIDYADCDLATTPCPRCGSQAGEECTSVSGISISSYIHIERQFKQALKESL